MLLNGFGFSNYRSFGNDLTKIAPLRKVNIIIGQNNSGKSNIINFLKHQYPYFLAEIKNKGKLGYQSKSNFGELDHYISKEKIDHRIAFPLFHSELEEYIAKKLPQDSDHYRNLARKVLNSVFLKDENCIWFVYKSRSLTDLQLDVDIEDSQQILEDQEWNGLFQKITRKSGGGRPNWVFEVINHLSYIPSSPPDIEVIPAIRRIGKSGSEPLDFSGEGIIERLAKIQNPALSDQQDKRKFFAINQFVQSVLENSSANINIPHNRDMILVDMDEKILPLDSLGTGVHEVIILASAATLLENTILCIEEPELHLHPLLQKKLVKYLAEMTTNQYLLTTHSAHLLDGVEAEIFHVNMRADGSRVDAVFNTKQRSNICFDLGYKASDILQANCIIWVEGPSDRIYLNYWIKSLQDDLIEGIHYSIMFYGGRLFSHLTALDDDEIVDKVNDFVSVRSLNRNSCILFDSDRSSVRDRISATKKRLQIEFDKGPGFAWITKGREIENYLDMDKLEKSILEVHPSAKRIISKNIWSNLLKYERKKLAKSKMQIKSKLLYTSQVTIRLTYPFLI